MENKKLEKLRTQWKFTGFPKDVFDSMIPEMEQKKNIIERTFARDIGESKAIYTPKVTLGRDNEYYMNDFRLLVEKPVKIEPVIIRGVDIAELDKDMSAHNWNKVFPEVKTPHDLFDDEIKDRQQRQSIMDRLQTLNLHGTTESLDAQERLSVKHFRGTVMAAEIPGFEAVASKQQYQVASTFPTSFTEAYTSKEAFNMLEGRGVWTEVRPNAQMIKKVEETGKGLKDPHMTWVMEDLSQKKDNGEYMRKYYYKQTHADIAANGPLYPLAEKVAEFPILDIDNPITFGRIMDALYKGNVATVFLPGTEKPVEYTFETNLIHKSVTVKNKEGRIVSHKELGKIKDKEKTAVIAQQYGTYLDQKKSANQDKQYMRQPKDKVKVTERNRGVSLEP